MFSLEGEESKKIGEILGNENCKKILNLLAEKELSESDLARELGIKTNTLEYNLKKLISLKLVEKVNHFWSIRGKKIPIYRAANKHIMISPKIKTKGFLITGLLAIIAAFLIKLFSYKPLVLRASEKADMLETVANAPSTASSVVSSSPNIWAWFLVGACFALLVLYLFWRFREK